MLADGQALGAVVVTSYPDLKLLEVQTVRKTPLMPYTPGLLSFREIPVLLDAFERLSNKPNFILCDGHALAHPRRLALRAISVWRWNALHRLRQVHPSRQV